jgi:3'-5' exoribonuclease
MHPVNDLVVQQPSLNAVDLYGYFKGVYFVSSLVVKLDKFGRPYARIKLSDVLTSIHINCFLPHALTMLKEPSLPVAVDVMVSRRDDVFFYTCKAIRPVSFEMFAKEAGVYGLPLAVLSSYDIQERFFAILENIYSQDLVNFLSKSLLQRQICINYCLCPASLNHHHNYMGGLIEHSIEVAESILYNESLNDTEKQVGMVAALIHDIGKTRTMTPDLNRTSLGYFLDHDGLTLEICASAMQELDENNETDAIQLRHILTCNVPGSRYGFAAKTRLAVALQLSDRNSARIVMNGENYNGLASATN